MRKITTLLTLFAMALGVNAQNFQNGSFEDWSRDNLNEYDTCDHWKGNFYYNMERAPVVEASDAQDGNLAARVQNPSFVDAGFWQTFEYSEFSANALTGYYKTAIEGEDSAMIAVQYRRGNTEILRQSEIYITNSAADWTFFQIRLNKAENADSIRVMIMPTFAGSEGTSTITVDNFKFDDFVSTEDLTTEKTFEVYPNPASDFARVQWSDEQDYNKIELVNITGRTVYQASISRNSQTQLDLSAYHSGVYFVKVSGTSGQEVKRLIIR